MLTIENRPEEQSPWASIINRAPIIPHFAFEKIPLIINLIWETEE